MLNRERLLSKLNEFRNIIVVGPQRSGTTFTGYAISQSLNIPYFAEESFDYDNIVLFTNLLETQEKKVLQCPALTHSIDTVNLEESVIVWMVRKKEDIINSEKRISWKDEYHEKTKYLRRYEDATDDLPKIDLFKPISLIKYFFWENYQRQKIVHFIEIEYEALRIIFPKFWVSKKERKDFSPRQIGTTHSTEFKKVDTIQLFIDNGSGFSEKASFKRGVRQGSNCLLFTLNSKQKNIKFIRIDPANQPVVCLISKITINNSIVLKEMCYRSTNACKILSRIYYFDIDDPQIIFEIPGDVYIDNIEIYVDYYSFGKETLRSIIQIKEKEILQKTSKNQLLVDGHEKQKKEIEQQLNATSVSLLEARNVVPTLVDKYQSLISKRDAEVNRYKKELDSNRIKNKYIEGVLIEHKELFKIKDTLLEERATELKLLKYDLEEANQKSQERYELISNSLEERTLELEKITIKLHKTEKRLDEELLLKQITIAKRNTIIKDLEKTLNQYEENISIQEKKIRKYELEFRELTKDLKAKDFLNKTINTKLEREISIKNEIVDKLRREISSKNETVDKLRREVNSKNKTIDTINIELLRSSSEVSNLQLDNRNLKNSLSAKIGFGLTFPFRLLYNKLSKMVFFRLFFLALLSPVKGLKALNRRKVRVLFNALKYEQKEVIIQNFKNYLQGKPPISAYELSKNTKPNLGFTTEEKENEPKVIHNSFVNQKKIGNKNNTEEGFIYNVEEADIKNKLISIKGWVLHKKGILKLELWSQNLLIGEIKYGYSRTDVQASYPGIQDNLACGFEGSLLLPNNEVSSIFLKMVTKGKKYTKQHHLRLKEGFGNEIVKSKNISSTPNSIKRTANGSSQLLLEQIRFHQNKNPKFYKTYQEKKNPANLSELVKLIAFYLPQFHTIKENDEWWGKGFTEWTNVTQGLPHFKGHYQPKLPADLGFYDLADVEVMRKQVALAKNYGLYGFCFHYYWFSGRRLLEKPVNQLLNSTIDFPFCLCWANENWTRRWDGLDQDILLKQDYSKADRVNFVKDLLPYIRDKRYIRIEGRPLIIIYRPGIIPDMKKTLAIWKKEFQKEGIPIPIFACVQGFGLDNPKEFDFDVAIEFPPHKLAAGLETINDQVELFTSNYQGRIHAYEAIVNQFEAHSKVKFPMIRSVFPAWDNEARKKGKNATAFAFSTPKKYQAWLEKACQYAREKPVFGESLVFVNAWNEWAEGAYLEPDRHFGYAYLEATHQVLTNKIESQSNKIDTITLPAKNGQEKIIIVSHDAHKHGAQINALHKVRVMQQQFGIETVVLLLEGGALESSFREITETILLNRFDEIQRRKCFEHLKKRGFDKAICNTTVSGKIVKEFFYTGIDSISLIHELPQLIKDYKLVPVVSDIAKYSKKIVFATKIVRDGFNCFLDLIPEEKEIINPQGLYKLNPDKIDDIKKGKLRLELNIGNKHKIVGGLGFADHRKGIDLFLQIAQRIVARNSNVHFVWIGGFDSKMEKIISTLSEPIKENVHFISFKDDIENYLIDFDLFLLTSREDPFPSVVLEAFALRVPVVAFEGGGGIVELNQYDEQDLVLLAKHLDINSMSSIITDTLGDEIKRKELGLRGQRLIFDKFQYDAYCFDLLNYLDFNKKRVSVVVPNYNYANFLEERLCSIWYQEYPVFEVIVLDDKSTDESLDVIRFLTNKHKRQIRLIENRKNSGSVFKQWHKGAQLARGELLWIAEADDSAEPLFLPSLINLYYQDSKIGLAYCQSKQIDENGRFLAKNYHYYTNEIDSQRWQRSYICEGEEEIKVGLSVRNTILNVSSVLFKREALLPILSSYLDRIVNEFKVAGDWFVYLKLLENYSIGYSPNSNNVHRRHSSSVTSENNHLQEINFIHNYIEEKYVLDESSRSMMSEEIKKLTKQFSL